MGVDLVGAARPRRAWGRGVSEAAGDRSVLRIEDRDRVRLLTLDRPAALNAFM